jgi:hypothetical protein
MEVDVIHRRGIGRRQPHGPPPRGPSRLVWLVGRALAFPGDLGGAGRGTGIGPLHRLATIADVANTARWLASPAASYITGTIIEIDGGAEAPVFPHDTPDLRPAGAA